MSDGSAIPPYPTPGATAHQVLIDLSADEFACLCVLAARWRVSPPIAARHALCLALVRRHAEDQYAAVSRETAKASVRGILPARLAGELQEPAGADREARE